MAVCSKSVPAGAAACAGGFRPNVDPELLALSNSINRWTSVLDCRLERSAAGLEIEIVVFPGEKLPKLPSCARLVVRPWDPEHDEPFHVNVQK